MCCLESLSSEHLRFETPFFNCEAAFEEINNGRIAMFAILGQIVAELQTGKGPVEQFMG